MGSRDAKEGIKLIWAFLHLFIYMEIIYFLVLFFFSSLGQLGQGSPLKSYITSFNSWIISTTDTSKI